MEKKLHNHPEMEESLRLGSDHVIVDKSDWEEACQKLHLSDIPDRPLISRDKMLDDDIDSAQVTSFGRVSVLILSSKYHKELSDSIIDRIEDKTTTKFKGAVITLSKYRGLKVIESNDVEDYLIV